MSFRLPENPATFLRAAREFWARIKDEKLKTPLSEGAWYPFDTLSCAATLTELISRDYAEFANGIGDMPVADVGCADGDLAMLFAQFGADVDAIDHAANNFNRMRGVTALGRMLDLAVHPHDINLDSVFSLPRDVYGLTLFLGTLYHLKNPYGVLERLAFQTRWCILSTRIAQVTPSLHARVEREPVAYLADGREIANDATNYWIFSAGGLFRILQRTRWAIVRSQRVGCLVDSNPIDSNADERIFVLLKSRVHYPGLEVRLADGWHPLEESFRWTAKRFSLEVVLPLEKPFTGFALSVFIPADVIAAGPLSLTCRIKDQLVGTTQYSTSGSFEFVADLPPFALHEPILRLDFTVDTGFSAGPGFDDPRELGICVPVETTGEGKVGFRLFG